MSEGTDFWHEHLGRHLSDADPEKSGKAAVPTRLGKDDPESIAKGKGARVAPWPLGAKIPAYYIVSPGHAWLIGKVAMENTPEVTFLPADGDTPVNGRRHIAKWLLEEARAPFMVGVITEASPNNTFKVSHHVRKACFCESSGNIEFDLERVRADAKKLAGRDWKEVAATLYRYEDFRLANIGTPEKERARVALMKVLAKQPGLQEILPTLHVKPGSGEMELLRLVLS